MYRSLSSAFSTVSTSTTDGSPPVPAGTPKLQVRITDDFPIDASEESLKTPSLETPTAKEEEIATPVVTGLIKCVSYDFWRYFVNEANVNLVMAGNWNTVVTMAEAMQIIAYFRGIPVESVQRTDEGVVRLIGRTLHELREFFSHVLEYGDAGYKVLRELVVGSLKGAIRVFTLKMQQERLVSFLRTLAPTPTVLMGTPPRTGYSTPQRVTPLGSECGYALSDWEPEYGSRHSSPPLRPALPLLLEIASAENDTDDCKMAMPSELVPFTPFDEGLSRYFASGFGDIPPAADCSRRSTIQMSRLALKLTSWGEENGLEIETSDVDIGMDVLEFEDELEADSGTVDGDDSTVSQLSLIHLTLDDEKWEAKTEEKTEAKRLAHGSGDSAEIEFYDAMCSRITPRSAMSAVTADSQMIPLFFERLALAMHAPC